MAKAISKKETTQTAVEWLMEQMLKPDMYKIWPTLLERAKEMEKEQIIKAFTKGELIPDSYYDYSNPFNINGQNYYKETYGT